jgi:hypothetical protein
MKLTKAWAIDAGERIAGTFMAAFLGALVISTGAGVTLPAIQAAALAGLGAVVTLVKSLVGAYVGNPDSASILPSVGRVSAIPPLVVQAPAADVTMIRAVSAAEQVPADWSLYHPPGVKPLAPIAPHAFAPPPTVDPRRIPADQITPLHPKG